MNEFLISYKNKKQTPAPDSVEDCMGSKLKHSSKKPRVLKGEWKPGSKFTYINEKGEKTQVALEELQSLAARSTGLLPFCRARYAPPPGIRKYPTERAALSAWQTFLARGGIDPRASYSLVNTKTNKITPLS